MIQFSIFGIPVTIQPFFWLTMIILGNPLADSPQAFLHLGLFVLAGFISILVHELGHALMIRFFRQPTAITLEAFGGYATFPPGSLTRPQSFLVTAAGPLFQLVLAGIAFVLTERFTHNPNMLHFLGALFFVSFFWALLNLLPVLPLDGGRLVEAVLGRSRIRITLWISIITAIAAAGFGATKGLYLLAIFFGMFAYQSIQALRLIRRF